MTTQYSNIPLEERQVIRVLRELTGEEQGKERCGLDLVIMFDISITNIVNGVLKTSTECVINALGPIDRLSVFTFSDDANMLCGLRQIHEKSKQDILNLVGGIVPDYGVINISEAIETALQLLNARKLAQGRSVGIILMTNSEQNTSENASQIKSGSVPVYSFSFGSSGQESLIMPHVLEPIARSSSDGETFSDVENTNDSSFAFSECFAGIWTVAVRILKLSRKKHGLSNEKYEVFFNADCEDYDSEECSYIADYDSEECSDIAACGRFDREECVNIADFDREDYDCGGLSYQIDYEEEELTSPLTLSSHLAYERPGFTTRDDTKKQN